MAATHTNENRWKISKPISYLKENYAELEVTGHVATQYGYVQVFQSFKHGSLYLAFICNGYRYDRFYDQSFELRYLVTLANRFAAECTEKEAKQP